MSLVRFERVSKFFAGAPVLDAVDFRIEAGEKIGLIGRNGTGKTTVLRLVTGEIPPDGGVIERMRKARAAYLAQLPRVDETTTILDLVMSRFSELLDLEGRLSDLERAIAEGDESLLERYGTLQDEFTQRGGYEFRTEVKRVLQGLGFGPEDGNLPVRVLSGGQVTRLMLALVLLEDADLLLLDEPENHLDIDGREWVETYLKECPKAVVIISHDRRMLNAVVDRIVEVELGQLQGFTGNYDAYFGNKALVCEQQQKAYDRQQEFIRKEESWIDRFRYKNTKARQVQSRIKRLEKLERIDAPASEAATGRFTFGEVVRTGEVVLDASHLTMAYGDLTLYAEFSFQVHRGERIGMIGPNGSGKTTLLRHLAARLERGEGAVTLGHKVSLGFYEQQHESLNRANDILNEIGTTRPDLRPEQIRSFMGRFLFTGDDVFKPIAALSGGELSRVALAKLILTGANVLLLDEPTNHLDIASREALEGALAEFPGAIVIVSHDRTLIDRLSERLIVIENGRAAVHLGNYSDYRWKLDQTAQKEAAQTSVRPASERGRKNRTQRADDRDDRERIKRMEQIEADIEAAEDRLREVESQFDRIAPGDYERFQPLGVEYEELRRTLTGLYAEWERLTE